MAVDINENFASDPGWDVVSGTKLAYISGEQNIGGEFNRSSALDRYCKSTSKTLTQDDDFEAEFLMKFVSPWPSYYYGFVRCGWINSGESDHIHNCVNFRAQYHPPPLTTPPPDPMPLYMALFIWDDAGNVDAISVGPGAPTDPDLYDQNKDYKIKLKYEGALKKFSAEIWTTDPIPVLLHSNYLILTPGRTFQLDAFGIHNRYTGQNYWLNGRVDSVLATHAGAGITNCNLTDINITDI